MIMIYFFSLQESGASVINLKTQHRMHPEIARFPYQTFYAGIGLDLDIKVACQPVPRGILWPNPSVPIVFYNIEVRFALEIE